MRTERITIITLERTKFLRIPILISVIYILCTLIPKISNPLMFVVKIVVKINLKFFCENYLSLFT